MSRIINDEFLYTHMPKVEEMMLKRIPLETELSHKFSWQFQRKMKVLLKYERRTPAMRQFVHQMKTAVVILSIVLSMTFGAVMSVEAYRVRLFKYAIEIWEKLTSVVIHSEDNADYDILTPIELTYVPDGYYLFELENNQYEDIVIYQNDAGAEIYFSQRLVTQSEFIFDSENADKDNIIIEEQTVYILVNKNTTQLYWYDKSTLYSLIGSLDKLELIKMAESIIKK